MSVGSVRDFDFHPDEDDVRVFTVDAAGVLRVDPAVFVSHARYDDAILWHYAFAERVGFAQIPHLQPEHRATWQQR